MDFCVYFRATEDPFIQWSDEAVEPLNSHNLEEEKGVGKTGMG